MLNKPNINIVDDSIFDELNSDIKRLRVCGNKNLHYYYESHYRGLAVQTSRGPLVEEWLEAIDDFFYVQRERHSRILVLRFDLRFPRTFDCSYPNVVQASYFQNFRRFLKKSLDQLPLDRTHGFKYVAAREYDKDEKRPHYHVIATFNGNAIRATGNWDLSCDNMYRRIHEAWANAIGIELYASQGLVHFCNPTNAFVNHKIETSGGSIMLDRNDSDNYESIFYACSYLAKSATKNFYDGCQPFLHSRL